MNCDEVAALLAADADGEVDGLRSHAIRRHLAGCAHCAQRIRACSISGNACVPNCPTTQRRGRFVRDW